MAFEIESFASRAREMKRERERHFLKHKRKCESIILLSYSTFASHIFPRLFFPKHPVEPNDFTTVAVIHVTMSRHLNVSWLFP